MFHKEFYPTPDFVMPMMGIDCRDMVVYEPHGGKGDVIDFCVQQGAKEVLTSEINPDLRRILGGKECTIIGEDFMDITAEQISHVQVIVMNPPFSNADKHIDHAWNIAPEGCDIISLCNYETINKDHRYTRLGKLIENYGISSNIGNVFARAERRTSQDVEIGLVKLFKPIVSNNYDFNGFFMDDDEEEEQGDGIIKFNEVRALVQGYVSSIECFDEVAAAMDKLNQKTSRLGISSVSIQISHRENVTSKEQYAKYLQKESWRYIFKKMNMEKYLTQEVKKKINAFVEQQEKYPFTMKNIYHMMDMIFQTRGNIMNQALEEIVDKFTEHTHENRFGVEGWKTNSGHMLNKKFIINYIADKTYDGNHVEIKYPSYQGSGVHRIDDLTKVLCSIIGRNYDSIGSVYEFRDMREDTNGRKGTKYLLTNHWYEWGFFKFKVYKKGTMHLKFKNIEDWYSLNKAYGELKGFSLPEKYCK